MSSYSSRPCCRKTSAAALMTSSIMTPGRTVRMAASCASRTI
jgi:hypothetical protein